MQTVRTLGKPSAVLVGSGSADDSSLLISVSTRPCVAGSSLGQSHYSAGPADSNAADTSTTKKMAAIESSFRHGFIGLLVTCHLSLFIFQGGWQIKNEKSKMKLTWRFRPR